MQLPDFILSALLQPQSHSVEFTEKIRGLGEKLSKALQTPHQLTGSDYCANLCLRFDATSGGAKFEVRVYLSTKAPLYAFYVFGGSKISGANQTRPGFIDIAHASQAVQSWVSLARMELNNFGLREVPQLYFFEPAPNCFTELDGLPADVFQALFAEIL
jgi:hypothetical protein